MGCYDVTCAISNTGISGSEPVIIAVLNEGAPTSLYNLVDALSVQSVRKSPELEHFERGLTKKHPKLFDEGYFLPFKTFVTGIYDEYGGIEGFGLDENYNGCQYVYFHIWAAEALTKMTADRIVSGGIHSAVTLFSRLRLLRKSHFDLSLLGNQTKDIEEMQIQFDMNHLTNKYLLRCIQRENEDEDEDEL